MPRRSYTCISMMRHAISDPAAPVSQAAPGGRSVASDLALLVVMLLAGPPGAFWMTLLLIMRRRTRIPADACGLLAVVPALLPEAVPVPVRVPVENHPRH